MSLKSDIYEINKNASLSLLKELNKPFKESDSFYVDIKRYFTDVNGVMINKLAAPASMQIKFPVYLFNKFDKDGGFKTGAITNPPMGTSKFLYSFTVNSNFFDWFRFQGGDIYNVLQTGDLVLIYCDDITAITTLVWIVIHSPFQSIASIIDNSGFSRIQFEDILYICDNSINYGEPLTIVKENAIGVFKSDQIQPLSYKGIDVVQQDFVKLGIKGMIHQYMGIYTYFLFDTENIKFNFKIKI
jgi:hypothetical protein